MSGTIEIIGANLARKFSLLRQIAHCAGVDESSKILRDLSKIEKEYDTGTVNILIKYYTFLKDPVVAEGVFFKTRADFLNRYRSIITKRRFFSRSNRIRIILQRTAGDKLSKKNQHEIESLFKSYDHVPQAMEEKLLNKRECSSCEQEMDVAPSTSQSFCKKCGVIEKMYGTVFEDEQFYHQEGQRTKHGNYETNKHCKIWVERIQARESKDIPPKIIAKLQKCIVRDRIIDFDRVSCELIRDYLRQIRETTFNEHVPLIRKLLTGKVPPQLTDTELRKLGIWFDKVITIFEKIKPPDKTNCPYHPYFIYKILDIMVSNRTRKREILSCIHLQSRDTLIENDKMWRSICHRIPDFEKKYKPTNRYANKIEY